MNNCTKSEALFDAILEVAVGEAFQKEMNELPSNEELNKIYKPSPELDKRIKRLIIQRNRKLKMKRLARNFGKIAAAICIMFALSFSILLNIEATRNLIFNLVVEWEEKYTELRFDESNTYNDIYIRPTYLPEGFREKSVNNTGQITIIIYSNDAGVEITFTQRTTIKGTMLVDNENTSFTEVDVAGNTGYLFKAKTEDDLNELIWISNGILFKLTSKIGSDQLLLIAESIKK